MWKVSHAYVTDSNKNPGHQGSGELSLLAILHVYCLMLLLGDASTLCKILLREDKWKVMPSLSWTLPYVPSLCASSLC